jgi:AcrR family transcriptional regulator
VPRRGLDTTRVVDEAARIADDAGLEAVTLARIAQRLGVRAPSLYNHVDGRPALMRLLSLRGLELLADAIREAAVGRSGEAALRAVARAFRAFVTAHPGVYLTTVRAPEPGDEEMLAAASKPVEVMVTVLGAWGLEGEDAVHQVRIIRSALHGFSAIEAGGGFGMPLSLDESFERLVATLLAGLSASQGDDVRGTPPVGVTPV